MLVENMAVFLIAVGIQANYALNARVRSGIVAEGEAQLFVVLTSPAAAAK
jgi:hypothetical protein